MHVQIWEAGYLATGMEGNPSQPHKVWEGEAESFEVAVRAYAEFTNKQRGPEGTQIVCRDGRWSDWGCGLYSSFMEAAEATPGLTT